MNIHYFNFYNKFINNCKLAKRKSEYYEFHHIFPLSMGGENTSNNIIKLTPREHYIAHWILAKTYGEKMWYAFWMMNNDTRNKHYRYKNSRGYEIAKINHRKNISKTMKGKLTVYDKIKLKYIQIDSEEYKNNKEKYEHTSKGKSIYILNGKHEFLSTNDPLVISGQAKHIRVGFKHTEKTKEKMSRNGIKNKIVIQNVITGDIKYINRNEELPENYIIGYTDNYKEKISLLRKKTFSICKWITNGVDNKRIKIYSESDIPEGWHVGRTIKKCTCEFCGKSIDIANYAQYHGEKCKNKK